MKSGGELNLEGIALTGGEPPGPMPGVPGRAGAIYNLGTATVTGCDFTSNEAVYTFLYTSSLGLGMDCFCFLSIVVPVEPLSGALTYSLLLLSLL